MKYAKLLFVSLSFLPSLRCFFGNPFSTNPFSTMWGRFPSFRNRTLAEEREEMRLAQAQMEADKSGELAKRAMEQAELDRIAKDAMVKAETDRILAAKEANDQLSRALNSQSSMRMSSSYKSSSYGAAGSGFSSY